MPEAPPVNGEPRLPMLPLFAWAASAPPSLTVLDLRAARLAQRLRQPVMLVKLHMLAAGLGEAR